MVESFQSRTSTDSAPVSYLRWVVVICQTYGPGMDLGTQVIMSAYIGDTAEAPGGGKFANCAVKNFQY